MAFKITDVAKDLPRLNQELQRLDLHQQQITKVQSQLGILQKQLNLLSSPVQTNFLSQNNILFTWTGGTSTLSWPAAFVHTNGSFLHITAGSMVLAPSTYYWMAWNHQHQTMSAQTDYLKIIGLVNLGNMHILAQVFTGTGGQTGAAGGGGTEPGNVGNSGKQYKLF